MTSSSFSPRKTIIPPFLISLVLASIVILFKDAGSAIWLSWQQEEYSHGYLIPFLALTLLLNKIADDKIAPTPSWTGLSLIMLAVAAQFLFLAANVTGLQSQAFLLSIIGFFILIYGKKAAKKASGPLLLLLFSAPLPKLIYYALSFKMQMASTTLGAFLLHGLGISVYQDGNILDLGGFKLQVAEACNGLRYLFPLMSLGFLLAYMYKAPLLQRATLFLSTLPISIFMNGMRIALIGIAVDRWGVAMAKGLMHDIEGWGVFLGCVFVLYLEILVMKRFSKKSFFYLDALRLPSLANTTLPRANKPLSVAALLLVPMAFASLYISALSPDHVKPIPSKYPLASFPLTLNEWIGQPQPMSQSELSVLGTDNYFYGDYIKDKDAPVNLYLLYFSKQDSANHQAVHSPDVCLPGGGWTIASSETKKIILGNNQSPLEVSRLVITKNTEKLLVYYWFSQGDHTTLGVISSRLYMFKNALLDGRTNGASVRITTAVAAGETEEAADIRLSNFTKELQPKLQAHVFTKDAR